MASLLVTGAAGFIGANFVHYWLKKYPNDRVIAFDALTYAGNLHNISSLTTNDQFRFVKGDILDTALIEKIMQEEGTDTIVHFAAESHVDRSITGPDAFLETNIMGTHSLLKAAREMWLKQGVENHRFHHVSTDEVFGSLSPTEPAFTEEHLYEPNSPYSASKAASDHLVRAYHHTYGLKVTTSNCSNNYGPYHFPEKLIPLCITHILDGKSLPIYGDGKNIRDWLFVDDHCQGIDLVLKNGKLGDTYNIGGNNEWTNIDIVMLLCKLMDEKFAEDASLSERFPKAPGAQGKKTDSLITYVEDRLGHDWRYAIDAKKIMDELNYKPSVDFPEGIRITLDWYLQNESWWRDIQTGEYRNATL